jgi:hypothetical protein
MQKLRATGHWQPVLRRVWMGLLPLPQWALQERGTNQRALEQLGHLLALAWQRLRWRRRESQLHTSLSL